MGEPDNEYIEHAKKATELLKRSVEIHKKEMAGEIPRDEAIHTAVELNEQASVEMDIAIAALDKELALNPDVKPERPRKS